MDLNSIHLDFYDKPAATVTARPPRADASALYHRGVQHGMEMQARYEAAETNHDNAPLWRMTDYLSAKAANSFQIRRTLKIRSRYEAANNSYYRGIVETMVNDLVGTGARLQARTKDAVANKQIQAAWAHWARAIGLSAKLRVMAKGKIQDGEGFGLLVTNKNLRNTLYKGTGVKTPLTVDDSVQLDVNVVESDQCMTPDAGFVDTNWVDGIVLDQLNNPTEYHFLRSHPGDLFIPQLNPMVYDRWKPQHVLQWFRVDRPGQVRGIPEITPALDLFAQLRRYTKAVIAAAETAADIAAYLETEAPANVDSGEPEPFDRLRMERGMMTTLPWGTKIAQLKAEQPATTYEMFVRNLLREICRCLGIPLSMAIGDTSGSSYSSARMEHLVWHRQLKVDRSVLIETVLDKIFYAWLNEAIMIPGLLPDGLGVDDVPHGWFFDSADSFDPVKDATADNLQLQGNTRTLADIYAENGQDWEEQIAQRGKEIALLKKLNIPIPQQPGTASAPVKAGEEWEELAREREHADQTA